MIEGLSFIILTLLVLGSYFRAARLQQQINTLRRQFGVGTSNDVGTTTDVYISNDGT